MSIKAKLILEGKEWNVLNANYLYRRITDVSHKPLADPRAGFINVRLAVDHEEHNIFEWAVSPDMMKSGRINFFRSDGLSRLFALEFWDAYCIEYFSEFEAYESEGFTTEICISPGVQKVRGIITEQSWRQTDLGMKHDREERKEVTGTGVEPQEPEVAQSAEVEDKAGQEPQDEKKKYPVSQLSTSQKGFDFIKSYEGLQLKLYNDTGGKATIGYGRLVHKGKVGTDPDAEKPYKDGITKAQALVMLDEDIKKEGERYVKLYVKQDLTQEQFDALVSICFNIGGGNFSKSELLAEVNKGNEDAAVIAQKFGNWRRSNGEITRGLVRRRAAEARMYSEGVYVNN